MGLRHVWAEWGCDTCGQNGATRVGRVGRHVCAEWVRVGEQERKSQAHLSSPSIMFSAEYVLRIPCSSRKELMYFSGRLRFSTFWKWLIGFLMYLPRSSSEITSMSLSNLTPSSKSLVSSDTWSPTFSRWRLTHAVNDLICIASLAA